MDIELGYFVKWQKFDDTHYGVVVQDARGEKWILFPKEAMHTKLSEAEENIMEIRRPNETQAVAGWINDFTRNWNIAEKVQMEFDVTVICKRKFRVIAASPAEAKKTAVMQAKAYHGGTYVMQAKAYHGGTYEATVG